MFRPRTVGEAVEMLATAHDAGRAVDLLGGGTDLVPALRSGERRPGAVVALRRVLELRVRGAGADSLTVGAGVTYTDLAGWSLSPGLALAARVVGSAQIRNLGTVGGALGSARPTGDLLTFLTAADAEILVASPRGPGRMTLPAFLADGLAPDALVTAVRLPRPAGPQSYLKIGGRQAAYQALVSCAVLVDRMRHRLACAIGGVGRLPIRMTVAERFAHDAVDWSAGAASSSAARRFGELVSEAVSRVGPELAAGPRVSADYRRHAAGVLAARAFTRCLDAAGAPVDPRVERDVRP
ncbi:molybdopterin dehydrogenase [Frankia sp. CcI156]|nr:MULTISPECIES: FAD binding domain-containing protein [Frankia]OFB43984.1 molybdopterin dehydrogenase [Frankia sp. CgIM4]OHV53330.1 molybdopterin dehydrogenase [Frankia sp. CgIS1]ONH25038.1 molybdopterin dehydrogenase [Frankia sp. CcI156]ORT56485.1 molybdopterin dehydrogenase [Frankia sp. KB5]ORT96731.1 molybdopterin dehydrogenase [Frankia casuarinae]